MRRFSIVNDIEKYFAEIKKTASLFNIAYNFKKNITPYGTNINIYTNIGSTPFKNNITALLYGFISIWQRCFYHILIILKL